MGRRRKVDPKDWDIDGCRALIEVILRARAEEYMRLLQAKARYRLRCDDCLRCFENFYLHSPMLDILEVDRIGIIDTLRRRAGYPISYTQEMKRRDRHDDA